MKLKAFNLAVDKNFCNEMIEPVISERGITYSKFTMALIRKLIDQKKLSGYAVDSEVFPADEYKIMNMYINPESTKMIEEFREIFAPHFTGNRRSFESNKYLKDEMYGFFYNYDDKNMIELARKYGKTHKEVSVSNKRNCVIFYSTSDDIEFLRMLKTEYDINLIIKKYIKIMESDSYNIYNETINALKVFRTSSPNTIDAKKDHLYHCRFSLDVSIYDKLIIEANRYFLKAHNLFSNVLNYVKENIENFNDCKIEVDTQKTKYVTMNMYNYIVEEYNITKNSDFQNIIKRIDTDRLTEYVKHDKSELLPIKDNNRTAVSVIVRDMNDDDFYTLHKIRKSYSVSWPDIIRVALEKDLLKK